MRTAVWLAAREVAARRGSFLLGAGVIAAVVALAIATDSVARGGEERVAAQMDRISPPVEVVPEGVSATQLARGDLGTARLPPATLQSIQEALDGSLRGFEPRLIVNGALAGQAAVIVGSAERAISALAEDEIALGANLAGRVQLRRGDLTVVDGARVHVAEVFPSAGTIDDESVFLPLGRLQRIRKDGRINHVRVFLRAGADGARAKASLERSGLRATIIPRNRGDAVERDAPRSLSLWRTAALAAAALAGAAWLAFSARLNLAERRREIATLAAIGAPSGHMVGAVVLRSAATAAAGAVIGIALGTALGRALQAPAFGVAPLALGMAAGAILLSALVAGPVAAAAAHADPVEALEEV